MANASDGLSSRLAEYESDERVQKPFRLSVKLYEDFIKAIPVNTNYNLQMNGLVLHYLHNKKEVDAFLANLTGDPDIR